MPRPLADDASSQNENNASPVPRALQSKKIERSPLYLAETSSQKTLNDEAERDNRAANIKLALDDLFLEGRPYNRKNNRVLSTIASSSTTSDYPSQQTMIRESRSLDTMPLAEAYHQRQDSPDFWSQKAKKNFHSLEGCDDCPSEATNDKGKICNNNYPNGNVVIVAEHNDEDSSNEADMPLLEDAKEGNVGELLAPKRWRSLDQVANNDNVPDKKSSNSPWNWLAKIFNGNGLRNSNISLRRDVIAGYDLQSERESIV